MSKSTYTVETTVTVEVDESKFTPEWMEGFNITFFHCPTIEGHRRRLAMMFAGGRIGGHPSEFVEGYGVLSDMGIKLRTLCIDAVKTSTTPKP